MSRGCGSERQIMNKAEKQAINELLKIAKRIGASVEIAPLSKECKAYYVDAPDGFIWNENGGTIIMVYIFSGCDNTEEIIEAMKFMNNGLRQGHEE